MEPKNPTNTYALDPSEVMLIEREEDPIASCKDADLLELL